MAAPPSENATAHVSPAISSSITNNDSSSTSSSGSVLAPLTPVQPSTSAVAGASTAPPAAPAPSHAQPPAAAMPATPAPQQPQAQPIAPPFIQQQQQQRQMAVPAVQHQQPAAPAPLGSAPSVRQGAPATLPPLPVLPPPPRAYASVPAQPISMTHAQLQQQQQQPRPAGPFAPPSGAPTAQSAPAAAPAPPKPSAAAPGAAPKAAKASGSTPSKASSSSAKTAPSIPFEEQIHPAFFYPSDPEQSEMIYYGPGYAAATAPGSDAAPLPPRSECKIMVEDAEELPGIPCFHPTMAQFLDFEMFCAKIDAWGMRSGVVKIVPPPAWNAELPQLFDEAAVQAALERGEAGMAALAGQPIASVRIRNAISQKWASAGPGLWRQQNVVHPARTWNALQWAQVCASEAQRGPTMERMRANARFNVRERAATTTAGRKARKKPTSEEMKELEAEGIRTRSGRARDTKPVLPTASALAQAAAKKRKREAAAAEAAAAANATSTDSANTTSPPPSTPAATTSTPPSTDVPATTDGAKEDDEPAPSDMPPLEDAPATASTAPAQRSPTKLKPCDMTTPAEWAAFDYASGWVREAMQLDDDDDQPKPDSNQEGDAAKEDKKEKPVLTPKDWRDPLVCREIEGEYWRNLNFGKSPMYGADLKGTLFTDATRIWNVGHLPNILTRLHLGGKKGLPGVTTPYLYFGMWRATFAWHVEDMDLYSINYIHCGAPKQWYAIRQADNKRFEQTMLSAFPGDSAKCKHFLRHKQYLASPAFLASHNIQPLRMVHHAGEFVITYPYGYHSGFNMGFNVAESVNFALPAWLEIGRRAGWCNCEEDSVHMDVDAIIKETDEKMALEREAAEKAQAKKAKEPVSLAAANTVDDPVLEARRQAARERDRLRRLRKKQEKLAALGMAPPDGDAALPHADSGAPASTATAPLGPSHATNAGTQEPPAKRHKSGSAASRSGSTDSSSSDESDDRFCCFCVSPMNDDLVPIPNEPHAHAHAHASAPQAQQQAQGQPDAQPAPGTNGTGTPNGHGGTAAAAAGAKQTQCYAHRFCANFVPETWVQPGEERPDGIESVVGFENIEKARWALKCTLCPTPAFARQGVKVQCTYGTCVKAAHVGCAVLETTGWLLEVLPGAEADELEGRNKPKPKGKTGKGRGRKSAGGKKKDANAAAAAADAGAGANGDAANAASEAAPEADDKAEAKEQEGGEEASLDDARHVVLCAAHNPHKPKVLSPEAARREAVTRACVLALKPGELVEIRQGGSAWSAPLVSFTDADNPPAAGVVPASVCVLQNGVERTVKWKQLVFEPEAVAKAEEAYDAARAKEASEAPKPIYAPQAVAQVEAQAAEAARKQGAQKRKHKAAAVRENAEGTPAARADPSVLKGAPAQHAEQGQPPLKKPRKSNKPATGMQPAEHAWASKPLQLLNPPLTAAGGMATQPVQHPHHQQQPQQQQQHPGYARPGMSHMYGQSSAEHHAHSLSHFHAQQQQQLAQQYARYLPPQQHAQQRGYPDNMGHFMQQPRSAPPSHPFQPPGAESWHHGQPQGHWAPAPLHQQQQHHQHPSQQQHSGYSMASLNYAFRPPTDASGPPSLPAMRERPEDERTLHQLHSHAQARAGGVRSSPYYVPQGEAQAGAAMQNYLPPMYGSAGASHAIGAPYASPHGGYTGLPMLSSGGAGYGSASGASPGFRSQLPLPQQQQQQQGYAMHGGQQQQQQQQSPHAQYAHSSYSQSPALQSPLPQSQAQAHPQGHGQAQQQQQQQQGQQQVHAQQGHAQQQQQQQPQQQQQAPQTHPITSTPSLRGGA